MAFKDEVGSLDRIASAVETISGGKEIPTPTQSDKDKVLSVNAQGKYALETPSGGGSLVVNLVTEEDPATLNKKAGEIFSAYMAGKNVVGVATNPTGTFCFNLISANYEGGNYSFEFKAPDGRVLFNAMSADANPSMGMVIPDQLEVDFEDDGEGNYVGDVKAGEIYTAFDNGVPVNFRVPLEGIYFIGQVISATRRANDSYYFGTISDTTEYPTFDFEASDGDSYPVWIQQE